MPSSLKSTTETDEGKSTFRIVHKRQLVVFQSYVSGMDIQVGGGIMRRKDTAAAGQVDGKL